MSWQRALYILRGYGLAAVIISGVVGAVWWTSRIDARLESIDTLTRQNSEGIQSNQDGIQTNQGAINGKDGLRVRFTRMEVRLEQLVHSNESLQCRLALSNTNLWYRDYELYLWSEPISELSKPNSQAMDMLSGYVEQWRPVLRKCDEGNRRLLKLENLKKGFELYYAGDFVKSYSKFGELDQSKSLTHRFLAAAATKQADQSPGKGWRERADTHSHTAYDLAESEISSRAKEIILPIMKCNAFSSKTKNEALNGAKCFTNVAKKGIKPSFSYAAAASFYAAARDFENAIKMLRFYAQEPIKEIGRQALERDEDLRKLLETKYAEEYKDILGDL